MKWRLDWWCTCVFYTGAKKIGKVFGHFFYIIYRVDSISKDVLVDVQSIFPSVKLHAFPFSATATSIGSFFFKKGLFIKKWTLNTHLNLGKKIKVFLYLTCLLLYIDNVCITKIQRWKGVRFEVHLLHSSRCREKGEAIWPFPPRWLKRPNRVERHTSM